MLADWIYAGVILLVALAASSGVRRIAQRFIQGDELAGHDAARLVARLLGAVVATGGVVYALSVLGVRLGPVLGAIGIGGLAIAFAAQSILENLFASILLQVRHPFRHGDQIKTGEHEGVVEDVNFRTVVLRTFDGEKVLIPCALVLRNPIVNHTARGRRATTLEIGVAYDVDLEETLQVLADAAQSADGVLPTPRASALVACFGDFTIEVHVQFWHAADQASMARTRSAVAVAINNAGIDMPYPRSEVHVVGSLPADGGARRGGGRVPGGTADGTEPAVERLHGRRHPRR